MEELKSITKESLIYEEQLEIRDKINELVREFNALKDRFESTLQINGLWDGS